MLLGDALCSQFQCSYAIIWHNWKHHSVGVRSQCLTCGSNVTEVCKATQRNLDTFPLSVSTVSCSTPSYLFAVLLTLQNDAKKHDPAECRSPGGHRPASDVPDILDVPDVPTVQRIKPPQHIDATSNIRHPRTFSSL